jgi:hypothetical protein
VLFFSTIAESLFAAPGGINARFRLKDRPMSKILAGAAHFFPQHHATASHKQASQSATARNKSPSSSSEEATESGSEKLAESVKASASKRSGRSGQSQAATTTGKFLGKLV